jgi:HEAT repeat protein
VESGSSHGPSTEEPAATISWREWWNRHEFLFTYRERVLGASTEDGDGETVDPRILLAEAGLLEIIDDKKSCDVRSWSATALGKLGRNTPEIRNKLIDALLDGKRHYHESADAALALGTLRVVEATQPLLRILSNKKKKKLLRCSAAVALGLMKSLANRDLLERIFHAPDSKKDLKAAALLGLGLLGDERSAFTLTKVLLSNAKDELKTVAVASLARTGVSHLVFRRGSRSRTVDLAGLFETLLRRKTTRVQVRRGLALALGTVWREETTLEVLRRVYRTDRDEGVKGFALISLALMKKGDPAKKEMVRDVLLRALKVEGNARVRGFAALACGLARDVELGAPLLEVFNGNERADVRAAAAVGLGVLRYRPALPDLAQELRKPRDGGHARGYAAVALGMIGDPAASGYLKWILKNVNVPYLKWASATGLALLRDRTALPLILECIDDRNLMTRVTAIRSLAYFRDLSTVKPLMDQFRVEKLDSVRECIVRTMGMILDDAETIPACRRIGTGVNWAGLAKRPVLLRLVSLF